LAAFVARGYVDRICVPDRRNYCDDTAAGMNVNLTEAQSHGADTAIVMLSMGRGRHCPADKEGFAAAVAFVLVRRSSGWIVLSHRVVMIT
jgi:hypothetical protein